MLEGRIPPIYAIYIISMGKLFSIYAIHNLLGAFRNVTPRTTENPCISIYMCMCMVYFDLDIFEVDRNNVIIIHNP